MKKILEYISMAGMVLGLLYSCTPSDPEYFNIDNVLIDSINSITLRPNHYCLIADGVSELELNTVLYKGDEIEVLESRIQPDWVEYYTREGKKIDKFFKTTDVSSDTIKVYAQLKGYDGITDPEKKENLRSRTVNILIRKPLPADTYDEITYPVVFHLIQTSDDIKNYGEAETFRLYEYFDKLNRVFARESNVNPNGADTRIRFKLAEYDPYGQKLPEIGVNRFTLDKGAVGDDYDSFICSHNLNWDYNKYINVWLIMGAQQRWDHPCCPYYISAEADTVPPGLSLSKTADAYTLPRDMTPIEGGIVMDLKTFTSNVSNVQDITFYFGRYFGLLDNTGESTPENYCYDTFAFTVTGGGNLNKTFIKRATGPNNLTYYFTSDNIMDDATGLHKTVTMDQTFRIRTICKWSPGRQQYRSDFAFTGK